MPTLYALHRPKTFNEFLGNEKAVTMLKNMLSSPRRPQVFLFTGMRGCGKTTLARLLAKKVGTAENDFKEIDTADFKGIETVRGIRELIWYAPLEGDSRTWLLDECHELTNPAQEALLKALDEPPPNVYFILATTEPQKLLKTLRDRCIQIELQPLTDNQILKLLRTIVQKEHEVLTKDVYMHIVKYCEGRPRFALQILEMIFATAPSERASVITAAAETEAKAIELCRELINKAGWKAIRTTLKALETKDAETIRRIVLGYCSSILLSDNTRIHEQAALVMDEFENPFYNTGWPGLVFACFKSQV